MPARADRYEVISVSLPRGLVERANALIPRSRRSQVIGHLLTRFLDSVSRQQVVREYEAYYAARSTDEAREEETLLGDWELSDRDAWAILEREESRARRPAR